MNTLYLGVFVVVLVIIGIIALESLGRLVDQIEEVIDRQGKVINQQRMMIEELQRIDADDLEGLEFVEMQHPRGETR